MGPPVCFGGKNVIIVRKRAAGISEAALARFVGRAARAIRLRGTVNVLLTGNRELQGLNRRFRGKDQATDVLSFPSTAESADSTAGEIAISVDMATANSKLLGHSPAEELKILALHGMLHLAGYDHERDNGAMARKEERLRQSLGLPTGLIKRTESVEAGGNSRKSRKNAVRGTATRDKFRPRQAGRR